MRTSARLTALTGLMLASLATADCTKLPGDHQPLPATGTSREARLASGQIHLYDLPLTQGDLLLLRLDQDHLDVAMEIRGPRGEPLLSVDSSVGASGPEEACLVAGRSGRHELQVRALVEGESGAYRLSVVEHRPATEADEACFAASQDLAGLSHRIRRSNETSEALVELGREIAARLHAAGQPLLEIDTLLELSNLAARRERLDEEIAFLEEAEAVLAAGPVPGSPWLEALIRNELGRVYTAAGRPDLAEPQLVASRTLYRELGDSASEAIATGNQALLLRGLGEAHAAEALYHQALDLCDPQRDLFVTATLRLNLAAVHGELGRIQPALDEIARAREIFDRLGAAAWQADARTQEGWVLYLDGQSEKALAPLEKAREIRRRAGLLPSSGTLDRLGTVLRRLQRFDEAQAAYRLAGELLPSERTRDLAHLTSNLGWLELERGRPEAAKETLLEARRLLMPLGERDPLAYVEVGLAEADRASGDLEGALAHMRSAGELVESLRASARSLGQRIVGAPLLASYDERHVDLLMELDHSHPGEGFDAQALALSDIARARSLYELLLESRLDLKLEVDPALLTAEQELQRRANALEVRLRPHPGSGDTDPTESQALERQLREVLLALDQARAEVRRASPRLAELREPPQLSLGDLQGLLDPTTLLVSYALGERRSFLFVLGNHGLRSYVLPARAEIEPLVAAWRQGLLAGGPGRAQVDLLGARLGEILLGPLAPAASIQRLLVVPHGALHLLPWSALPWPGAQAGERVVDRFQVVQLPSAAALAALRHRGSSPWKAPERAAVVADAVYSPRDPRVHPSLGQPPPPDPEDDLERLPASRKEAEALLHLLGETQVTARLGFEARRELLLDGTLAGFPLVHLAAHAEIDEEQPELSRLLLTRFDPRGKPLEGEIFLHEIYSLRLPTRLLVLSACETALGDRVQGEGLMGLARGFLYAGADRLLVSLWKVDDEATAALMAAFDRGLLEQRLAPSEALRQAQLQLAASERWTAPYDWAGFVLQGEPQ